MWHEYSSRERVTAEKVFEVRGQSHRHSETKCTFAAEEYISTVWRRRSESSHFTIFAIAACIFSYPLSIHSKLKTWLFGKSFPPFFPSLPDCFHGLLGHLKILLAWWAICFSGSRSLCFTLFCWHSFLLLHSWLNKLIDWLIELIDWLVF